jgi:hypothetical protein
MFSFRKLTLLKGIRLAYWGSALDIEASLDATEQQLKQKAVPT